MVTLEFFYFAFNIAFLDTVGAKLRRQKNYKITYTEAQSNHPVLFSHSVFLLRGIPRVVKNQSLKYKIKRPKLPYYTRVSLYISKFRPDICFLNPVPLKLSVKMVQSGSDFFFSLSLYSVFTAEQRQLVYLMETLDIRQNAGRRCKCKFGCFLGTFFLSFQI